MPPRHAVVDIGSGTTTLAVFEAGPSGYLDRIYQQGEPLQLMRKLGPDGALTPAAVKLTVATLKGFAKKARELGADAVDVVATSAVRDATNRDELLRKLASEPSLRVRLVTGEEEGRLAAHTVLCTLPLRDGVVVDMGGGSLQLVRVSRRRVLESVSLPLGAIRLTDRFLPGDVPPAEGLVRLRRHVLDLVRELPWLAGAGQVVAAGGSARALGKVDRRARGWKVGHGHGYFVDTESIVDLYEYMSRQEAKHRANTAGLPSLRVETIVAVTLVFSTLLRAAGATGMHLSTYGIREGVAFRALHGERVVADTAAAGIRGRLGVPALARPPAVPGLSPRERRLFAAAVDVPTAKLLDKPIQGFWQEELLRVVAARL